jgi:hypothetical protein
VTSCYNGVRLVAARGVEALPDSSDMSDMPGLEEEPHAESRPAISFPAVVLLFLVLATVAFLNSPYFLVRAVRVSGSNYLSDYEILLIAGVPENTNMFLAPTGQTNDSGITQNCLAHHALNKLQAGQLDILFNSSEMIIQLGLYLKPSPIAKRKLARLRRPVRSRLLYS